MKCANILRGRNAPTYTPHVDTGHFVVVIHAEKVKLSGRKEEQKKYQRYSGYRGGLHETPLSTIRERHPERLLQMAVKGMLPRNNLSRGMLGRLKVYAGADHPHTAQEPKPIEV